MRARDEWLDAAQADWERSKDAFPHLEPEDAEAMRLVRAIAAYEAAKVQTVRRHTNGNLR